MNPIDIFNTITTLKSVFEHGEQAADGDPWGPAGLGADTLGVAAGLLPKAVQTPVIEAGLLAIAAMSWMCGVGDSEKGDRFGEGGSQFNEIADKLESASPDGNWTGSGSEAYATQNNDQRNRAKTMVDADFDMNQIISCEANQLSGTRDILDHAGTVLGYAIVPALAALRIPLVGPEISLGIQLGAVAGTVPVCQAEMINMALNAVRNAQSVENAIDLYNSANPDPSTRTMEVGLWGAPRSVPTDGSTDESADTPSPVSSGAPHIAPDAPSVPTPTAPRVPTPTAPPSAPSPPTPSAPSVPGASPNIGSALPSSTPPVTQAPSMPAARSSGSPGPPSTPPPSAGPSSASAPLSMPGQAVHQSSPSAATATQLQGASKGSAVQELQTQTATSGTTSGERAPVSRGTHSDRGAEAPSAPTIRTGDTDDG